MKRFVLLMLLLLPSQSLACMDENKLQRINEEVRASNASPECKVLFERLYETRHASDEKIGKAAFYLAASIVAMPFIAFSFFRIGQRSALKNRGDK